MKFGALSSFFDYKNQQNTTATLNNTSKDTSTMVGTDNWYEWVAKACQALRYDCQLALLTNSLFLSALKTSVSLLSKKSILNETLHIWKT